MPTKMEVFFVALITYHVLVTKSLASSEHGWVKNKDTEGDDVLGLGVNNTGPNHQYSESRSRRAIVHPANGCYTQFFIGQKPPTGFRPLNSQNIKHICQQIHDYSDETYFATMFDERIGIAVYVGYRIRHDEIPLIGTFPRISKWFHDPVINRQGRNKMYAKNNKKIHRGHLVPAETYSFDCIYMVSTFRYTNAVPQYAAFNTGAWSQYEEKVRKFASTVCRLNDGDLYLLTGTSEAVIIPQDNKVVRQALTYFPAVNYPTSIAIPNSMWTAGCCIKKRFAIGAFAAIGNNVQVNPKMYQVTVNQLQDILAIGIHGGLQRGVGRINLFPGHAWCSKDSKQYKYKEGGWTKVTKLK